MKYTIATFVFVAALAAAIYYSGMRLSTTDFIVREIAPSKLKDIKCGFWKYSDGAPIGQDILSFSDQSTCTIVNDTLYLNGEPKAVVKKVRKRYFSGDYTMSLARITDGKRSYYVSK